MNMTLRIRGLKLIEDQADTGIPPEKGQLELRLETGSITVLMGPNGVGKTRLMEITAGLRNPSEDLDIHYGNERLWVRNYLRINQRNPKALLAYSYSCQSPEEQLFARSVEDELNYVLKPYEIETDEKKQRMEEALQAVGWDVSKLSRDPYRMSGGERRRTALACLFAAPAAWLLLDEPTAGLDAGGHAQLSAQLQKCAAAGQGVLLISHESDWALGIADSILLMQMDGRIRKCSREQILAHPEWLEQAGMTVPAWLQIAHALWKKGIPADQIWNPAVLALGIASASHRDDTRQDERFKEQVKKEPFTNSKLLVDDRSNFYKTRVPSSSPLASFDPRAVWLSYLLLSSFMLMQRSWSGIAIITALTGLIIIVGRIRLQRWRGPIITLSFFTIMMAIFAGFTAPGDGTLWNTQAFLISIRSLLKPWLAMLVGLGLPLAVTPLRLRRSLEQLFSRRGRVPVLGMKIILTITLLLRFVPVLLMEWERFSRVSIARGKVTRNNWRGNITRIRDIAIPFMLSLFRLGDNVANALESRGVSMSRNPTLMKGNNWRKRDSLLLAVIIVLCLLLWWWAFHSAV
ncbi:hypothetical protein Back11_20800 [Paenibacillus baekrokdamisoli]|uniref:Uncharacterized protein n=1 Tax=Paenibacillus baekrokdamisoli TaxID=1712516 RepID=A0A3G9IX65_9BACL|nr:ATP-binding cassette domain-containing protein [Paenibacillus baekrokdamisoli]MBB3069911.1 energy-coupling factor transport system ATP-binding protein [Paenibacillus baekrokdamisoli]BBH20735.1 hypothetical protein Back11_20800 [Paenibacillus baekrokdamisoli]